MALPFKARYFLLVGWQVLLLLVLMGSKHLVLALGTTVVLATVPVDPRELFRGDYVALRYEIARLDLNRVDQRPAKTQMKRGDTVYAVLTPLLGSERSPWSAVALFSRKPTEEELGEYGRDAAALRGTVIRHEGITVELEYGIESYFVPEGKGRELERATGKALTVDVKVDSRGRAVIERVLLHGKPVHRGSVQSTAS